MTFLTNKEETSEEETEEVKCAPNYLHDRETVTSQKSLQNLKSFVMSSEEIPLNGLLETLHRQVGTVYKIHIIMTS